MPQTGLDFEKETSDLSKRVLDFFERVRYSFLSAKENPKEYGSKWKSAVEEIRDTFDSLDDFAKELKKYLEEKDAFADDAKDPTSTTAQKIYDNIKEMRFKSKKLDDPFSRTLGDEVIETFLENQDILVSFLHYAIRSHSNSLPKGVWLKNKMKPDEITQGTMGLDLDVDDIILYITEHYGEGKDTKRIKSKVNGAMQKLESLFVEKYGEDSWDDLEEIDLPSDLKKAETKSEEEKSAIDFIIPNKPMFRIFEIDDLKEIRGLSGEFIVQEKYDGMRIQIHKINNKVKIYSYNKVDITDKCSEQVEQMNKKHFGDCILDAELMLFLEDEPLHRADTITHVFKLKDEKKKGTLRAHVFDIMNHEGKNIMEDSLRERINILLYQYSQHSSETLAFPSKKDTRMADSIKEVAEYSKDIMNLPASEGVVIKDMESTYYRGINQNPKWIKWKKFVDLDVIVLKDRKTSSGLHSYTMGIGPVPASVVREYETVEFEDKEYLEVGKALNTKTNVKVGGIIRVKVDEVKKTNKKFSLYSAKVIEVPEVKESDKIETLEKLATKTKKSLESALEFVADKTLGAPYKVMSGIGESKVKKSYYVTDNIHGTAEIILKENFDGFTIYGFEGDSLMQKNALYDIDIWKEQLSEIIKTKRSDLRIGIKNEILESGRPKVNFEQIVEFVTENYPETYLDIFQNKEDKLMSWMKTEGDVSFIYHHPNKFSVQTDEVTKDVDLLQKENRTGKFIIKHREDDNVDFIIEYKDTRNAWTINIDDTEDIFNLFGKSGKYPAIVATSLGEGKTLDSGKLILGVQKQGYHEYKLEGDKFNTRLHLRVLPVKEKNRWLVWTGKKQEMLPLDEDEKLWDITKDKYAKLEFPA
tara:strand:+ start:6397 stop:9000 length:2604 start_codon:yes stop_codon:yes gene_type:complete